MRKRLAICGLIALGLLFVGGAADAARVRVGTLVLQADGGFKPRTLPRHTYAPISFQGHAEISTTDSKPPPALRRIRLDLDRDGLLTTAGLPTCPASRIEAATTSQARQRCQAALVGTGNVAAAVTLPGRASVEVRSPLTLFNGPRQGGNATVVAHARTGFPAPQTYAVVIPIERLKGGTFGYRSTFDLPELAGGYGALTHIDVKIARRYRFHGVERSYVSARCSDSILQTFGYASFADGTVVSGSLFKACKALP